METAASPRTSESAFHSDDLDQVAEYRSLSALAVVSLVFGLLSPVCVAHPFFLVIPLAGSAIAIVALQRIAASQGALAGRWAAIAGLALCVTSAVATVSYGQVIRMLRTDQARDFAVEWLDLLAAGKTEVAFRLTVASVRRPPPPMPNEPVPTISPLEEFEKNELVQSIAAAGEDAKIEFLETANYQPAGRRQYFLTQRFTVTPDGDDKKVPIDVTLTLQRSSLDSESPMRWLVRSYERPGAVPDSPPAG